jgi:hypothetical protein
MHCGGLGVGMKPEGQLRGQLLCREFSYHIGFKGFPGFLVSPRHHLDSLNKVTVHTRCRLALSGLPPRA